jgi:hypothetical protein
MSAKTAKPAAPIAAKKTAAKKAVPATTEAIAPAADAPLVPDGTSVVFIGFRSPITGEPAVKVGELLFISSYNDDDTSYNVAKTAKGIAIDTLYREEFRLATAKEITDAASPLTAKAAKTKTDSEMDNGTLTTGKKDKEGKTILPAKKAAKVKTAKAAKEPKPAKVKKVKEPKVVAPPPPPIKLLGSAKKAIEEAGDLISAAEALMNRAEATDFTLGGVLAKIEETAAFEAITEKDGSPRYGIGHVGFGNFCEAHLGLKYRKATYLIKNYAVCVRLGITEAQIKGIGWSKLKEAVGVLSADNFAEILQEAKDTSYDEFAKAMKERKVATGNVHGNTTATLTTFTFKVFNDKAAAIKEALLAAKAALGAEGDDMATMSAAFDHIVTEWMQYQG